MPAGGVNPSVPICAMEICQPGAHTRSLRRQDQTVVRSQFCDNDVMPVSSLGREDCQSVARASVSVACRGPVPVHEHASQGPVPVCCRQGPVPVRCQSTPAEDDEMLAASEAS